MKCIYDLLAEIYYHLVVKFNFLYEFIFVSKKSDFKSIPIIINNRNRYSFLKQLVEYLLVRDYNNIIILDNNSTYPPLHEYYTQIKKRGVKIVFLGKNLGFKALEKIELYQKIKKNYYVYTDPDVVPIDECPDDFLEYFYELLQKYQNVQKVGFSLKIDDLPKYFDKKNDVINWERSLYRKELQTGVFEAPIDTTFALHRPLSTISTKGRFKNIRTMYPYEARHLPWYNDSLNLSEEEKFYINHVEIGTHWSTGDGYSNSSFFKRILEKIKSKMRHE